MAVVALYTQADAHGAHVVLDLRLSPIFGEYLEICIVANGWRFRRCHYRGRLGSFHDGLSDGGGRRGLRGALGATCNEQDREGGE